MISVVSHLHIKVCHYLRKFVFTYKSLVFPQKLAFAHRECNIFVSKQILVKEKYNFMICERTEIYIFPSHHFFALTISP